MSGGFYDYAYGRVRDLADDISGDVTKFSTPQKGYFADEIIGPLPVPCLDAMKFVAGLLEIASQAAHDVEWMMSDDTGPEELVRDIEAVKKQLLNLMKVVPL